MRGALIPLAIVALVSSAFSGMTGELGTREEATAMVQRVQEKFRTEGPDATFTAVTLKQLNDRDLYPFIVDWSGVTLASGGNSVLVGKNLMALKDQDGRYLTQEIIAMAQGPGKGWLTYKWPNPTTRLVEDKITYIEKMGAYVVGVGVWQKTPAP